MLADLDIQKLTWGLPSETLGTPFHPMPDPPSSPSEPETYAEISSAAEAAAYMQQVALKLRDWRQSVEKAVGRFFAQCASRVRDQRRRPKPALELP